LRLKRAKKASYLRVVRALGFTRDVWFHGTSDLEVEDINRLQLPSAGVLHAEDIGRWFELPEITPGSAPDKRLKIAFLSRLTPNKNLDFALEALAKGSKPLLLDVYGPSSDPSYAEACRAQAAALPEHLEVRFRGEVPPSQVGPTLAGYDVFLLPTLGENFGHAIHEALMSGVPVLISDRTPWRALEPARAGWDLSLDSPDAFLTVIEAFAELPPEERLAWRRGARAYAEQRVRESGAVEETKAMFEAALTRRA
jgi:glycosyltransferase involved in cell wall biosynthesis